MGDHSAVGVGPIAIAAGQQLLSGGAGRVVYTSVIETSGGAPCSFTLFDGNPATNQPMMFFSVNPSGSTRDAWPEHGVPFEGDLWIGSTAGQGNALVWVVPEDLWDRWLADAKAKEHAAVIAEGWQ